MTSTATKKETKNTFIWKQRKKNHNFKQIIFNSTEKSHSCDKNNFNLDPIATKYLSLFEQNDRNNLASTYQCDPARKKLSLPDRRCFNCKYRLTQSRLGSPASKRSVMLLAGKYVDFYPSFCSYFFAVFKSCHIVAFITHFSLI